VLIVKTRRTQGRNENYLFRVIFEILVPVFFFVTVLIVPFVVGINVIH